MSLLDLYRLAEEARAGERLPMMLFPFGEWKSAKYPKLPLTRELADELIANFEGGVLGTEPVVDSSGKHDESTQAAGWVKRLYVAATSDGGEALFADWEPTDLGAELLNSKRYAYNSVHIDSHIDNTTGGKTPNVLKGVSLTNTPVLRILPPVLEAGERIAAAEPIEVALSELEAADDEDPVAELINDIDSLLAKLDERLKGKTGIRAMRTMLRETRSKASAHTMSTSLTEPDIDATAEDVGISASEEGVGQSSTQEEKEHMSELTEYLKLDEGADEPTILAEVKKVTEERDALVTERDDLAAKLAEGEKADRVHRLEAAIEATEVLPAEKDGLLKLAESDAGSFDAILGARKGLRLVDTSEKGSGETPEDPKEYADASVELAEKAERLAEKDGIEFGEAMSRVLADDPALAERYLHREEA